MKKEILSILDFMQNFFCGNVFLEVDVICIDNTNILYLIFFSRKIIHIRLQILFIVIFRKMTDLPNEGLD